MNEIWPVIISVHAVTASLALILGAYQLFRPTKGGKSHRFVGRIWVVCIYIVIASSFGIQTLNGGFSWLHALSVLTFITVTVGLVAAIKGRIKSHKSFMQGSYYGILGAFIGVVVVPTRRIPQMAMFDLPSLVIWGSIVTVIALSIIGISQLIQKPIK